MKVNMTTSLHSLRVGQTAEVVAVANQPLAVRMQSMGIRPGAVLTVLAKTASSSRLVRVGDARLALAKDICRSIEVDAADVR